MGGLAEACVGCAAAMVYAGPISMVLPQGAQTALVLVDAKREPVVIELARAGSSAVATNVPESGRVAFLTATSPGLADIMVLAEGEGRGPVALSITVVQARPRIESDGPMTLELVLAEVESEEVEERDEIISMIAGVKVEGWEPGRRSAAGRDYEHFVNEAGERARVPADWRMLFPSNGRRLAHGPEYALWEAPKELRRWLWRDGDDREFWTGPFEAPREPIEGAVNLQ